MSDTATIIYWRDIPAQVVAGSGRQANRLMLSERFQEAIDRAATRAGLIDSDDYMKEIKPAVNEGLLEGRLAWRQHDGGHTDGPNWKYFIPWAERELGIR